MTRLLCAALLVFSAGMLPNTAAAANLLNNPSFESDLGFDFSDVTNWNGFFGGPPGTFLEAFNDTGAPPNSGAKALEITLDGDATFPTNGFQAFVGQVQSVASVGAGDPVDLSVYARNNGSLLTGNVEFRIEFIGDSGEIAREQINLESLLTDTYQQFGLSAVAPAGTTSANVVFAVASFNQDVLHSNSVLFDDVSLTIVPEPASAALLALSAVGFLGRRRQR